MTIDRTAIISPDATREMLDSLVKLDIRPVIIPRCPGLAPPLRGHPDLQVFVLGRTVYCHRNIDAGFLKSLGSLADTVICPTELGPEYPADCSFNIALAGNFAFHRADITDPVVRSALDEASVRMLDVRQGYSKCSTVIVSKSAIITADAGIHRRAEENRLSSLLVVPGHVCLPGYEHGFLGGASGSTEDTVFFTGPLDSHPDRDAIIAFIMQSGKKAVFLSRGPLVDLGSILFL